MVFVVAVGSPSVFFPLYQCDVFEYFCNDLFEDVGQPTFSQGDYMQACITSTGYVSYMFLLFICPF